jgi:hypothetical protein
MGDAVPAAPVIAGVGADDPPWGARDQGVRLGGSDVKSGLDEVDEHLVASALPPPMGEVAISICWLLTLRDGRVGIARLPGVNPPPGCGSLPQARRA